MSQVTDEVGIEKIMEENEMIIMKAFGIEYEKFFPQNHQCEKVIITISDSISY